MRRPLDLTSAADLRAVEQAILRLPATGARRGVVLAALESIDQAVRRVQRALEGFEVEG